ncbi:hypothetical protein PybrP1_005203 [[Pythium] brassicae (nom. inval.)]|nr:hypothetical protein PybrP1_005203 [[Pythium] brassicae (nom. inval.)]
MDADALLQIGDLPQPQSLHRSAAFASPNFGFGPQTFTQALASGNAPYAAALYFATPAASSGVVHAAPSSIPQLQPAPTPSASLVLLPPLPMDAQWAALKTRRWSRGKDLTAFVQDLALQSGKRALVATSGGSYKKFVCSSASACPWLINAVCSRPRKRPREKQSREGNAIALPPDSRQDETSSGERFWYITSGHLAHANCASAARPTARQLRNSALLQAAVQGDARVSSAVLVERLRTHGQLECSKSMVYKAKSDLLDALTKRPSGPLCDSVQQLPSFLAQLSARNAHVMGRVERDDASGCFVRAVLALDPARVWNDQCVLGVDSRARRSGGGFDGTELVLVGRDGNLAPIVHAVALVPDESPAHCAWFLEQLLAHGFPLRRFPLFTNGRAGVLAACAAQRVPHALSCTQHVAAAIGVRGRQEEALIWRAQQAETERDFAALLRQLAQRNVTAAQLVARFDPARWALFPHLSRRKLYGWQTTLVAATLDHLGPAAAAAAPFEFFQATARVLARGAAERHERAVQWERERRAVTPEAERLMRDELQLAGTYSVAMSAPELAFVWCARAPQPGRQRRVDLQHRTCTCAFRMQWGVPCRHVLAVLQKTAGGLARAHEFFDECYLVRTYASSFKGRRFELPPDESVERDPTLRPARLVPKADADAVAVVSVKSGDGGVQGPDSQSAALSASSLSSLSQEQPPLKKRRVRNRPLEQRKRGIYKCHHCHRADGHNKGTCPYPQGGLSPAHQGTRVSE